MPYFEKRIQSGDLLEVERYYATDGGRKILRSEKTLESKKTQAEKNMLNAQKRLVRLVNTNFDGRRGDLFVTLTHEVPVDEETARREAQNYLKRVRNYRKKAGLPDLKYIVIHEKQGQWHSHVIMNAIPLQMAKDLWGRGRVTLSELDKTYSYRDLVNYLTREDKPSKSDPEGVNIKQPRRKGQRRWISSQNLSKPVITVKQIRRPTLNTQPSAPKGYRLLHDWETGCDGQGNIYQSYSCVRIEARPAKRPTQPRRARKQ